MILVKIQTGNGNKSEDKGKEFLRCEFIRFKQHREEEHYENPHLLNGHNDGRRVVNKAECFQHVENRFQNADGNGQKVKAVIPARVGGIFFIIIFTFKRKVAEIRQRHHIIAEVERDFACAIRRRHLNQISCHHIQEHCAESEYNPNRLDLFNRSIFVFDAVDIKQRDGEYKQAQ